MNKNEGISIDGQKRSITLLGITVSLYSTLGEERGARFGRMLDEKQSSKRLTQRCKSFVENGIVLLEVHGSAGRNCRVCGSC